MDGLRDLWNIPSASFFFPFAGVFDIILLLKCIRRKMKGSEWRCDDEAAKLEDDRAKKRDAYGDLN